jgi:hypothetical protein
MDKALFDYLVANQSKWAELYKKQKEAEHQVKRIQFMKTYNVEYRQRKKAELNK